ELLFGGGLRRPKQGNASVIDEDLDVAVARLGGPLGQFLGRREVAQRDEPIRRASSSAGVNLGNHIFGLLFVSSNYQYVSASGRQCHGCGPADTARRTCHKRGLAL